MGLNIQSVLSTVSFESAIQLIFLRFPLPSNQELLQLFGVPYLVSPMEAEAQCAMLDALGLTEGSITNDSDIFLFGGTRVYKNIFNQKEYAELYESDTVQKNLG